MNKNHIEQGKLACYGYIEREEDLEKDILEYILQRIAANRDMIEKLLEITNEKMDFSKVEDLFKSKESKYKKNKKIAINEDGFINGTLITQKGVILREESNVEKVIETYIDAILSRNAMVIADREYLEVSVKNLILEIIHEALAKFEVDKNLIQLLPYEEVNEDEFSNYLGNNKIYVYLENEDFRNEVGNEYVIEGELDEVIDKINSNGVCECAVIYTDDRDKAYKFINRVNGRNVFVNTSFSNKLEDIEVEELYIHKNVIYPTR